MRAAQEQRFQEEQLRRREQELAEREMDIVERELHLLMCQMSQEKPRVRKRKGNFKRSRLLKLREGGSHISLPSGTAHIPGAPHRPPPQRLLGAVLTQALPLSVFKLFFLLHISHMCKRTRKQYSLMSLYNHPHESIEILQPPQMPSSQSL